MVLKQQQGAVLVVSLLLLLVMTLLAVSSINMSTTNLKIVANNQQQMEAEAVVQEAIQDVLSSAMYFNPPGSDQPSNHGTRTGDVTPRETTIDVDGITVSIEDRQCLSSLEPEGSEQRVTSGDTAGTITAGAAGGKVINYWQVVASYADNVTGANVIINQGVAMKQGIECNPL